MVDCLNLFMMTNWKKNLQNSGWTMVCRKMKFLGRWAPEVWVVGNGANCSVQKRPWHQQYNCRAGQIRWTMVKLCLQGRCRAFFERKSQIDFLDFVKIFRVLVFLGCTRWCVLQEAQMTQHLCLMFENPWNPLFYVSMLVNNDAPNWTIMSHSAFYNKCKATNHAACLYTCHRWSTTVKSGWDFPEVTAGINPSLIIKKQKKTLKTPTKK